MPPNSMIIGILGAAVLKMPPKVMGIWTCEAVVINPPSKVQLLLIFFGGVVDSNPLKVLFKLILKKPPLKVMIIWNFGGNGYITFGNPRMVLMTQFMLHGVDPKF